MLDKLRETYRKESSNATEGWQALIYELSWLLDRIMIKKWSEVRALIELDNQEIQISAPPELVTVSKWDEMKLRTFKRTHILPAYHTKRKVLRCLFVSEGKTIETGTLSFKSQLWRMPLIWAGMATRYFRENGKVADIFDYYDFVQRLKEFEAN